MKISHIHAHEILASGGYPTVEVAVTLNNGTTARASVPYGASAGTHEATVLVDGDQNYYRGKGVQQAMKNVVNVIQPVVKKIDPADQRAIDGAMIELDGTPNKAQLGGNAILAVSLAIAKVVAKSQNKEMYEYIRDTYQTRVDFSDLPNPMVVVIEGGKHAHDTTDLQEYCITAMTPNSRAENVRKIMETYHALKEILKEHRLSVNVGNEGAFAPNGIPDNEAPFGYMVAAMERAGYEPGVDVGISIDAAASEFYQDGQYQLAVEGRSLQAAELIEYYQSWLKKYPIVTYEDMLAEDDWDNWVKLNQVAKQHGIDHIGDDLTVTSVERLQKAIDLDAITAILIKLNQIGSLTETVDTCMLARKNKLMTVPSHRGGGETNDTSMVDLAVAVGSKFIKVGPTRGERVCKYNRLMEIERQVSQVKG